MTSLSALVALGIAFLTGDARQQGQALTPDSRPENALVRFHHVHLNTTSPEGAVEFYTSRFPGERAKFAGQIEAVRTGRSWLLFNRVNAPPPWQLTSAIWHFGWGAVDMKAEYDRQLRLGTRFFEPLTDISDIGGNANARPGSFYYAYAESPDRALIELNTAPHHHFGHLHLFSADPVAAGEWYARQFEVKLRPRVPSREPRFYRGFQIGPSVSFVLDGINVIIFPVEYSKKAYAEQWKGRTELESTPGRVIDHLGIGVDKLDAFLEKMRRDGVKIRQGIRRLAGSSVRSALVEGPDRISLELIESRETPESN
ncbi:MAG: VOC family protein [Blastocatellia bacterium]